MKKRAMVTTKPKTRRKGKVVGIFGGGPPIPQANKDVIAELQSLLDEAKSGQIAGLVYAAVAPQGHIRHGYAGNASHHSMIAAVSLAHQQILHASE